jgi:FtsP/CotA-like multicopper oxidase with cupredoxin domain
MKSSYIAILANMLGAGVSYAQFSNTSISPSRPTCTQVSYQTEGALSCANNVPGNRSAWCDHSIDTDYTNVDNVPNTGITREYWLEVGQGYLSPEGSEARFVMTVNGTIPGPTIYADWGDEVVVHVKNNLTEELLNGTSIHWHGIRQYQTNQHDGVVSLTQCPIAPSKSMTYRWRAVQYGSSWYHSHLGLQAWEGVFGGIVINGPATANYDVDMGSLFLSDWTNQTVDTLYQSVREDPDFGLMNNGLINGTNTNLTGAGCPFVMKVDEGKSYQLRIVNAAMDTHWDFGIDNHTMKVIAMDFVPIEPFDTPNITIAMGLLFSTPMSQPYTSTDILH